MWRVPLAVTSLTMIDVRQQYGSRDEAREIGGATPPFSLAAAIGRHSGH